MFEYYFDKKHFPSTSIAFILLYNVMGDSMDVLKPNKELFSLYTGDHIIYNTLLNSTIAINQAQSCIQTLYKPAVSPSLSLALFPL